MDFFPEESYDPDSGEYTSGFDFDPIFESRVNLSDGIHADIHTDNVDFTPTAENLAERLEELVNLGYFDVEGNRNPLGYPPLPDDFDKQGKTARGPFVSADLVENFFNRSGLRGQVPAYYDEENDLYWIDADTN